MKTTLILTIALILSLNTTVLANEMPYEPTFLLEGRADQLVNVHGLVSDLNPTNYYIGTRVNTLLGDRFRLTFTDGNGRTTSSMFHLSDKIIRKYLRHRKNGTTGEQILEVCGTQASSILIPLRAALAYAQESTSLDAEEITSRLDLIDSSLNGLKDDHAGLRDDHDIINANLSTINGKMDTSLSNDVVLNDKLDKIINQNNRNFWGGLIGDGLNLGATIYYGERNKPLQTIVKVLQGNNTTQQGGQEGHHENGLVLNRVFNTGTGGSVARDVARGNQQFQLQFTGRGN